MDSQIRDLDLYGLAHRGKAITEFRSNGCQEAESMENILALVFKSSVLGAISGSLHRKSHSLS